MGSVFSLSRNFRRVANSVAAIDIGTNSTRLLVAEPAGDGLRELARESRVTRLGRGVDCSSQLSAEGIEAVCAAIADYTDAAGRLGATRPVAFATSAVRDASNGGAFIAELRERFGLEAVVLDGEEEARLTYKGALAGREVSGSTLVIDIGGGSTELVIGDGDGIGLRRSLQCGVVRQSERHLGKSDPPDASGLEALADEVRSMLATALPLAAGRPPERAIAVAGTPTSLAAIDLDLEPYDPERVHGHVLGLDRIARICSQLSGLPLAERERIPGLQAGRAPTIVAGVVILIGVMRSFGLEQIEVSEHDILHGVALEHLASAAG